LPNKRLRKNVPLLVGNIGAATFGADHNQAMLCDATGLTPLKNITKDQLAVQLIFEIAKRLPASI
jgi:phosphopantothenoylcysteine decarboxylase/phosphopantothenate--cysteine ligase